MELYNLNENRAFYYYSNIVFISNSEFISTVFFFFKFYFYRCFTNLFVIKLFKKKSYM